MADTLSEIELNRIDAEIRRAEKAGNIVKLECRQARALFDYAKMGGRWLRSWRRCEKNWNLCGRLGASSKKK